MFTQTFFFNSGSLRKNLWDAEDRLRAVDLSPENDADKPLVAIYTYDAGGERTIKYVPARIDARYSAKEAGNAERFESIIYPNALVTAKTITFPEINNQEKDPRIMTYTKHYYIGSERIASVLGTKRGMGAYCGSERPVVRDELNDKVTTAGETIEEVFEYFGKHIQLPPPFVYSDSNGYPCSSTQVPEDYGAYWYHPDHLGSSSYITNLNGEVAQHMEYLPFGETLVEEHLNSNNSPYKFNAKEFDAETGNYYYGARYYSPKYNLMLSVDPAYEMYPGVSPFVYTLQNPVRYVDPTGMFVEDNPVFSSDGTYRGNTIEGYTGDILIYDGDLDFSQMSAHELEFNIDDGATHYDFKRHELSGEAKSKIWTHVVSQLEGMKIYDETFSMDDLTGGKIHFDGELKDNWAATYILGRRKGTIRGSDKYNYETTVENLQSSIGVHEWYSHIKKNQGDDFKSHRLAYKNVINFKSLWNNTTKNYKEYNMWGLREYNWRETGRKTVDKPYLRLSNQYNELKNRFK